MKRTAALLVAFSLSAATIHAQSSMKAETTPFDYTREPFAIDTKSTTTRGGVVIEQISYPSPKGGPVPAILVRPQQTTGRHPALLFMHWGLGDRHSFLEEAVRLADLGAISLMIDAPWHRPEPWRGDMQAGYRDSIIRSVVDLRRGLDLLTGRADVDATRVGFVGLSFGAHMGALVSSVEDRVKAAVLMGGSPSVSRGIRNMPFWQQRRASMPPEQQKQFDDFIAGLEPLDAERWVGMPGSRRIFYQFTKNDEYITHAEAKTFYERTAEPKLMKWYEGGHEFGIAAERDRLEWLHVYLRFPRFHDDSARRIGALTGSDVPQRDLAGAAIDYPGAEHVVVKKNLTWATTDRREQKLDVHYPFGLFPGDRVPAVILVSGTGAFENREGRSAVSAARLVAAGARRIAITWDSVTPPDSPARTKEIQSLVTWLEANAAGLQIDAQSLALWTRGDGWLGASPVAFGRDSSRYKAVVAYYPPALEIVAASTTPGAKPDSQLESRFRTDGKSLAKLVVVSSSKENDEAIARLEAAAKVGGGTVRHRRIDAAGPAFDIYEEVEATAAELRDTLNFFNASLPIRK